jgi:DNA-binding transcriptional LysR family regulator
VDRLSEYESFLRVSRTGSFTSAAADLGVSASAISKQVKSLEERLGVRLLNRTTRRVALTEEGRAFSERMESIVGDIAEAESAVTASASEPRGVLRVGAPMDFGRLHLAEPIARFAASHPRLEIEIELSDRFVDLVEEGLDVIVRIGELADSSLVSRRLAPCRRVICAAPGYLDRHGRPAQVEELGSHHRIGYAYETERSWLFESAEGPVRVDVPVAHRSNNGEITSAMVVAGLGIGLLPTFIISDELRAGRLETLLADQLTSVIPIHAVYPHRKHLSAKVRAFVDHLGSHCGATPYWDEGLDFGDAFPIEAHRAGGASSSTEPSAT